MGNVQKDRKMYVCQRWVNRIIDCTAKPFSEKHGAHVEYTRSYIGQKLI
jgi:RecA-family ATPase